MPNEIDVAKFSESLSERVRGFEDGVKAGRITSANFDARKLVASIKSALPDGGAGIKNLAGFDPTVAGANIACDEGC